MTTSERADHFERARYDGGHFAASTAGGRRWRVKHPRADQRPASNIIVVRTGNVRFAGGKLHRTPDARGHD